MKLKERCSVSIGYSNKLKNGDKKYKLVELSTLTNHTCKIIEATITSDMEEKLRVKENSIIIAQHMSNQINPIWGNDFINCYLGKNLYSLNFNTKDEARWVYYLLKSNLIPIPYQGTIIKQIRREDLLDLDIPKINHEILDVLNNIQKVLESYESNFKKLNKLQQGIIQKIIVK